MRMRHRLTIICLAAVPILFAAVEPAPARDLTIVLPTSGLAAAEQATLIKRFIAATGIPVATRTIDDPAAALLHANPPDVLLLRGDRLRAACQENQLEKIDWSRLGGKDHFPSQGVQDCGLGAAIVTTVLAWDLDKFPATPTWQDFWDITKLPGKRGLRQGVRGTLEIALMADGVAPGEVYRTLASDDGVERAFRKLDQLKPYIVWWRSGIEAARILGSGDVLLTSAPNGEVARVAQLQKRNLGLQWSGSLIGVLSWAVRRDSGALDQAAQFLQAAADPAAQAALQTVIPYGGIAPGANDNLPAGLAAYSSGLPAHLAAGLAIDEDFWRDHFDQLTQRFEAWLK